jgi:hypothetical protein
MDEATLDITSSVTRLEQVSSATRADVLDNVFNEAFEAARRPRRSMLWAGNDLPAPPGTNRKAGAKMVRGKPENPTGLTNFGWTTGHRAAGRRGGQHHQHQRGRAPRSDRRRGHDSGHQHLGPVAGRAWRSGHHCSQASMAPGVKVRICQALPHAGLGVKSYA